MESDTPAALRALYDQVAKCGKCGFCQPACPVYRTTYREAHVARGKHALVRNLIEGETVLDADLRDAFDNCLLCRACTASCFSDLKTDRLVVAFREAYARRFGRSTLQRVIFRGLLPDPRRMRQVVWAAWAAREAGLDGVAARWGLLDMINPKLTKALELREGAPGQFLRVRLARPAAEAGGRRGGLTAPILPPTRDAGAESWERGDRPVRVGYWISCGYNYMLPEVGVAAVSVLRRAGASVEVLPNACCGLPVYGYGDVDGARALARRNIEVMGDLTRFDAVVSECGSCSGHLKEYPELFADDGEFRTRARRLAAKVRSFSEFLVEQGCTEIPAARATTRSQQPQSAQRAQSMPLGPSPRPPQIAPFGPSLRLPQAPEPSLQPRALHVERPGLGAGGPAWESRRVGSPPLSPTLDAGGPGEQPGGPLVVTFHEPCHLGARFQGVVSQPRDLLRSLPGVEFRELPEADRCCGAAGSYNVLNPEVSAAILARKMEKVASTGADVVVTECPSCMLQLSLGAKRAGSKVRVLGISEMLAGLY